MSTINTFQVAEKYSKDALGPSSIAQLLVAGERVVILPVGEVFMIPNDDGPPDLEFVYENSFIEAVVDLKIKQLEKYKEGLRRKERNNRERHPDA